MRYTVVNSDFALYQLTDIWLRSPDKRHVTDASDHIDRVLREDPDRLGDLRPDGHRTLVVAPLVVTFEVSPDDRKVTILSFRYRP